MIWHNSICIISGADPVWMDYFVFFYFILCHYYIFVAELKLLKETKMHVWIKL